MAGKPFDKKVLLELTVQHHEHVYGDQGVLNMYFGDQWLHLNKEYNFMVGLDQFFTFNRQQ